MTEATPGGGIDRSAIVRAIRNAVEPLEYVHAMWEGGAIAFDRLDEWSDIDLYVDADDEKVEEILALSEKALRALAPIARRYDPPPPPSAGYVQAFFHLEGTSPFLLVDLAAVRHSSTDKFLEPEIHGRAIFHFNKGNRIAVPHVNGEELRDRLKKRAVRLRERAEMFWIFIDKQLGRGIVIEALDFYQRVILGSLVEVLRIRYLPARHGFATYYIHYDLPPGVVKKLEGLFFVKDLDDLRKKRRIAEDWFYAELAAIDSDAIGTGGRI
jgi:hypothetical protein